MQGALRATLISGSAACLLAATAPASVALRVQSVRFVEEPRHLSADGVSLTTEVPPWFVRFDGAYRYFASSSQTTECRATSSLRTPVVLCDDEAPVVSAPDPDVVYKHSYQGVYSAESVRDGDGRRWLLAFQHAENKNDAAAPSYLHNTVRPRETTCRSGYVEAGYRECYQAYSGFVTASVARMPDSGEAPSWRDRGPIVWPKSGYVLRDGSKASWGVRHPTSIAHRGRVYVFYLDTGSAKHTKLGIPTQGIGAGIAVARAPAAAARAGAFQVRGRNRWSAALPRGFAANRSEDFLGARGPRAARILGRGRASYFFAATRLRSGGFLGLESRARRGAAGCPSEWIALELVLWRSADLVRWRDPTPLRALQVCGETIDEAHAHAVLRYPHFLDRRGRSQSTVDAGSFYLVGTADDGIRLAAVSLRGAALSR